MPSEETRHAATRTSTSLRPAGELLVVLLAAVALALGMSGGTVRVGTANASVGLRLLLPFVPAELGFLSPISPISQPSPPPSATLTVDSTGDDPDADPGDGVCATASATCTLRAAIQQANALAGLNTIAFGVGSGHRFISPISPLPTITDPLVIDGTTQPGFVGTPIVELTGGGSLGSGLDITGGSSTVRGLVINGFVAHGIRLSGGGGNVVAGNYVGTDAAGAAALGNGTGVYILSVDNTVGGAAAGARNVVSGNGVGVYIAGGGAATGNLVQGNYVGTDAAGATALGNTSAGMIVGSGHNTVGGTAAGAGNVVSGNNGDGIVLGAFTPGDQGRNVIQGNYVGTDATGTAALGNNASGVLIYSHDNTVGGTVAGAGNVISGNQWGIVVFGGGNLVQGNYVGTDPAGAAALGNSLGGVLIAGTPGNAVLDNSIFANAGLGIDLLPTGVTPNDLGDADAGANNGQNFPMLTSAVATAGGTTTVAGVLNSTPGRIFGLQFFASPSCDPSGHGEGQRFLGSATATTNGGGDASFAESLPASVSPGELVTATATDPENNTSEFSACAQVTSGVGGVSGVAQSGGMSLDRATVELFSGTSLVATTTADTAAAYSFTDVAPGTYTVRYTLEPTIAGVEVIVTPGPPTIAPSAPAAKTLSNHSWPNAYRLDPLASTGFTTSIEQHLVVRNESAWFKFRVQPGSKVIVQLSNLPADYDLTLYKDIDAAYKAMTASSQVDLARIGVEFAPEAFAPEAFAPEAFAPEAFAPEAFAPEAFAPEAFAPEAFAPEAFAPEAFAPEAFAPEAFAPEAFARGDPDDQRAFSSVQSRSVIAVGTARGTSTEEIVRDTWTNDRDFYVRVRGHDGAFSLAAPFLLDVTLLTGSCAPVEPIPERSRLVADARGYRTLVLSDFARLAGMDDPEQRDALRARLDVFVARQEVAGIVVDVGEVDELGNPLDGRIAAAKVQADAYGDCPYAKNLLALEIKRVVDDYRRLNETLEYVVLVGNDHVVPFFRDPDRAGLASETEFFPPVLEDSASQASLRHGYVLSQDRYGARLDLSLKDHTFPVPDLAVGRLVETAADATALLDAYLPTTDGVTPITKPALVTGYDFLADAAEAVAVELSAGMSEPPPGVSRPADKLIQSRENPPIHPSAWTADQLRAKLVGGRHDIIFLAGHFSASGALAADYTTRLTSSELADPSLDLANVIVFSLGCHAGYSLVDRDAVVDVTVPLDFAQAFNRRGASLVAGTGYQYGDTDFLEYGERLYLAFSQQLRTGAGPVPIGKALVQAKKAYLAETTHLRGIHEKTLLQATLFGLPHLSVSMPGARLNPPGGPRIVTSTTPSTSDPGHTLGLRYAEVTVNPLLAPHTRSLTQYVETPGGVEKGASVTATYLAGSDGVVTNPAEPVLPLELHNVKSDDGMVRGALFLGGRYTDAPDIRPLVGAPATEIRGAHAPFHTDVFFPLRPWGVNYFEALAGGRPHLVLTPAQFRSSAPRAPTGTLRRFDAMTFRLYYSQNQSDAALADAPAIANVSAVPVGADAVTFGVTATGHPVAGVQEVWITYTATRGSLVGEWRSLALVRSPGDPTRWIGQLSLQATSPAPPTAASDVRYIVQAVNGVGLVGLATNLGAYYAPGVETVSVASPKRPTVLELNDAPASASYRDTVSFSARLTTEGKPLVGQIVAFTLGAPRTSDGSGPAGTDAGLGSARRSALTDQDGVATTALALDETPGRYQVRASFEESDRLLPTSATRTIAIDEQATSLTVVQASPLIVALRDCSSKHRPLPGRAVLFTVAGNGLFHAAAAATDFAGHAALPPSPLPPGAFDATAYFGGTRQLGLGPPAVLPDGGYRPSHVSTATVSGCLPDLVVTSFTASPTTVDRAIPLRATLRNQGTVVTDVGFRVHIFADRATPPTAGDPTLLTLDVAPLGAGQEVTVVGDLPAGVLPAGSHTLSVLVDGHDVAREANETNNAFGPIAVLVASASTVKVTLDPSTPTAPVGAIFEVAVRVDAGAQPVDGAEAHLDFDPTRLEVVDDDPSGPGVQVTPGTALGFALQNLVDNATGRIDYAAGAEFAAAPPTQSFRLATVRFRAKAATAPGGTPLSFSLASPRRTEVTFGGVSVFGEAVDGSVTILPHVILRGCVALQGRGTAGDPRWRVPLGVTLYPPGSPTPILANLEVTTDPSGCFERVLPGLAAGTYDVEVKHAQTLSRKASNVSLILGQNASRAFGALPTGDVNDDNQVSILDFSILRAGFGTCAGDPRFDGRADLEVDTCVGILDFSWLRTHFGQIGPLPASPELTAAAAAPTEATLEGTAAIRGPDAARRGSVSLAMRPARLGQRVGDVFQVRVELDAGGEPVDGVQVHLAYDPRLLRVVDAAGAPTGALTPGPVFDAVLENRVDHERGRIAFAAGALAGAPARGRVTVATLTVRALQATGPGPEGLRFVDADGGRTLVSGAGASLPLHLVDGQVVVHAGGRAGAGTAPGDGAGRAGAMPEADLDVDALADPDTGEPDPDPGAEQTRAAADP